MSLIMFSKIDDVEWASQSVEVLKALRSGTDALNQLHEQMPIDMVEALMEETAEAIEVS